MSNKFNESKGQELSQIIDFQWQNKFGVDAAISAVNEPILSGSINLGARSLLGGLNLEEAGRMITLYPNLNAGNDLLNGTISLTRPVTHSLSIPFPGAEAFYIGKGLSMISSPELSATSQLTPSFTSSGNKLSTLNLLNTDGGISLSIPKTELWKSHLNVDPVTRAIMSKGSQSDLTGSVVINSPFRLTGYDPAGPVVVSASYKPYSGLTRFDAFNLVSQKPEVIAEVWNNRASIGIKNPSLFTSPNFPQILGESIRVAKDGSLFLRAEAPIVYQPPSTSSKVRVNYALATRLGNINQSIKESYISAVRILNSRDYEYTRYMCLSLRQVFDYFVKHLPNKAEMLAWAKDKPEYFVYNPDCGKLIEDRISSIGVYMFLTKHVSGYPDGKEFRKVFDSVSPAIHAFKVMYNYEQGVEVLKKCEQMITLILDANDALNN